jgi:hypothetical protein
MPGMDIVDDKGVETKIEVNAANARYLKASTENRIEKRPTKKDKP